MGRQLVFDLAGAPSYAADAFLPSGSNAHAHAMIERWPHWPDRTLLLIGPAGAGKSHLGAIWAARTNARIVTSGAPLEPASGEECVLVEDADTAAYDETAFFHLLNTIKEQEGWLLLTARTPPDTWGIATRDLLSRLRLAPIVSIATPDGDLLRAVLVKLFADRQIRIEPDVVAYAALHCEQSLDAVQRFVAAVDADALAEGRRITRPLAARTLSRLQTDEAEGPQGPT